jgi:hypothetical protein
MPAGSEALAAAGRMADIAPDTCCGCLGALNVSGSSEELPVAMMICL